MHQEPGTARVSAENKRQATELLRSAKALPSKLVEALNGLLVPTPTTRQETEGLIALRMAPILVELPPLLAEWYRLPTWVASRGWLTKHLTKLPPNATRELERLTRMAHHAGQHDVARQLDLHRQLLIGAQNTDVNKAYRAIIGERAFVGDDVRSIFQQIQEWLLLPNWNDSRTYLQAHPALLTPVAEAALEMMKIPLQTDQKTLAEVEKHLKLLQDARNHGIDRAYKHLHTL